jgi:replicative DNA helicase
MMVNELSYMELKSHQVDESKRQQLKDKAKELKKNLEEKKTDIFVMDDVRSCTVDRIYAELVKWKPDIACIDYISLMDSRTKYGTVWEKTMYITQNLKQIARNLKIPIIGVAQTNRASFQDGAQMDNVAGSISIIQDSDIVLGLFSDQEMKREKRMQIRMLKNRDGMTDNTDLKWDLSTMTFEPWRMSQSFA